MQIYGPFRVSTTQATGGPDRIGPQKPPEPAAPTRSGSPVDQLDLSYAASGSNRVSGATPTAGSGEIRIDRVADIRRQIAAGNYETPEKLDAALDRLLDQLG